MKVNLLNLIHLQQKDQNKKALEIINKFRQINNQNKKQISDAVKESKNRKALEFHTQLTRFSNNRLAIFINSLAKKNFEVKLIEKNKSIENCFENVNILLGENYKVIMRSNKETVIIEKALNRIFGNMGVSLSKVFHIWRENKNILAMQNAMSNEKKKNVLNIINKLLLNKEKSQIPVAVKKFEKNYKTTKLMK